MNKEAYRHLRKLGRLMRKRADLGHSVRFGLGGGILGAMAGNYLSSPKYKWLGTGIGGLLGAGAGAWLGSLGDMDPAASADYQRRFKQRIEEEIASREQERMEQAHREMENYRAEKARTQEELRRKQEEIDNMSDAERWRRGIPSRRK